MTISTQRVFCLEGIICHVKACWGDTWPRGGQKWKWTWQVNRKWNWFYKLFDMSRDMSGINPTMSNFWSDNTILWLVTSILRKVYGSRFSNFPKLLSHSGIPVHDPQKIRLLLDRLSRIAYHNFWPDRRNSVRLLSKGF